MADLIKLTIQDLNRKYYVQFHKKRENENIGLTRKERRQFKQAEADTW